MGKGKQNTDGQAEADEIQRYRKLQKEGHHTLPYKEFLRAKELGIDLPEADPVHRIGVGIRRPLSVSLPSDIPLEACYRVPEELDYHGYAGRDNALLLATLGDLPRRFFPAWIEKEYDGYTWAKLRTVENVEVTWGKTLYRANFGCGAVLECVESLVVTAYTSDGKRHSGNVCLAAGEPEIWSPAEGTQTIFVTPEARTRLRPTDVLDYIGLRGDDPIVAARYLVMLSDLWLLCNSGEEAMRQAIVDHLQKLPWGRRSVTRTKDGAVVIELESGKSAVFYPKLERQDRTASQG